MRVLFVTNMYPIDGYSYYGIHVKEQIDSIKNEFLLDEIIFFINGKNSKLNYLYSIFRANYLIHKEKFDIIHIHYGISGIFLLFNPFIKSPIVLTLHGSDVNTDNIFTRFIVGNVIARCSKIIVMNNQMYDMVKPYAKSLEVIPCGIDVNFFKPQQKIHNPKLVLGFSGNPERKEKNYPLFFIVKNKLEEQGYNVEVVIFHNLTRAEVVTKLNYITILLLTSFNEGSPQIIKEALACNTSVVSVPVGDIPDMLAGVDNCAVIKDHQPEGLVNGIFEIIQKKNRFENNQGRDRLKTLNLDQRSIASRIYNCYKQLLK